jgi:hypothetical protein
MMPVQAIEPPIGFVAGEDEHALPPDVTATEYWSGACACATVWLVFLLYAAARGFG